MANKTIYAAGKVYDLFKLSLQDIQADVQSRLDALYGRVCIKFTINVWKQSKEVTVNFWRSYNDWYKGEDDKTIFCADADLLTGRGVEGLVVPDMWPIAPFSTDIDYFQRATKKLPRNLEHQE